MSPYLFPLPSPSHHPYPTPLGGHKAPSWSPCAMRLLPTSYFTFGSVYMSMPLSHFVPAYPSPSPCPQVHSLHLRLYSCPAPRFYRTIFFFFRFHIYVLAYGICFSLSDLLHSVWQTLGPSTSVQITQFRFFLSHMVSWPVTGVKYGTRPLYRWAPLNWLLPFLIKVTHDMGHKNESLSP